VGTVGGLSRGADGSGATWIHFCRPKVAKNSFFVPDLIGEANALVLVIARPC